MVVWSLNQIELITEISNEIICMNFLSEYYIFNDEFINRTKHKHILYVWYLPKSIICYNVILNMCCLAKAWVQIHNIYVNVLYFAGNYFRQTECMNLGVSRLFIEI